MLNSLRPTPVLAALCLVFVAGCATGPQPETGPLFSELQRDAFSLRRSDEGSYGPSLERAVFTRFEGLSREQAMALLQADGFTCAELTCRFANADHVNWLEVAAGITNAQGPFTVYRAWQISLQGDPLNDQSDIQITFSSQVVSDP